ncbi:MAG: hypothetical protein IKC64_03435, partial [Clostridia bacterium]|nr:hypothetical protein [Clostridia bacterium]
KVVVICSQEYLSHFKDYPCYCYGHSDEDYAKAVFSLLRKSDDDGFDTVVCQGVYESGFGRGVYNRLEKACGGKTI